MNTVGWLEQTFGITILSPTFATVRAVLQWKRLDRMRLPYENKYANKLAFILRVVGVRSGDSFAAHRAPGSSVQTNLPPLLREWYRDLYVEVGKVFGRDTLRNLRPEKANDGDPWDIWDPLQSQDMMHWLRSVTGRRVISITGSTIDSIQRLVTDALASGRDVRQISREIQDNWSFGKDRADRIAKTEVNSAANAASHFSTGQFIDHDLLRKVWLATSDARVRKSHQAANGQSKKYSQPFRVGSSRLLFPGDTSLNAEGREVVGCRCTALYSRTPTR